MGTRDVGEDAALMEAFMRRDPRAAETLYARFAGRIYGLGRVMLGADQAAQDLVQDTFVKVWRSGASYDEGRGRLDTWILLTARSLAIDALRRRVLNARSLREIGPTPEASPERGPEALAETGDLVARARSAMAAVLTDEQRAALELAYFGGKTSAEVAELEGVPLGTAKTRIRTALLRLRDAMEVEP